MNKVKITPVILAGGKGTRLWPMSRAALPKQFCKLSEQNSLFQQTVERVCTDSGFSEPIILTNEAYRTLVETQLMESGFGAMQIICEPCGRDTSAALALATISGKQKGAELLLAVPSDHKILDEQTFLTSAHEAARIAVKTGKIVSFGIKPTEPATQYGYLEAGSAIANSQGFTLSRFIEKPSLNKAEELIANDRIFWNAGIFMFSPEVMYNELYTHSPEILKLAQASWDSRKSVDHTVYPDAQIFAEIPSISIDYAVMEKTIKAALVPVDPQWSDLGNWSAVWEATKHDKNGNALVGNALCTQTSNSYLSSDGPFIGVAGVSDIVVVANRDAVLVTSRKDSQGVKQLIEKIRDEANFNNLDALTAQMGRDAAQARAILGTRVEQAM